MRVETIDARILNLATEKENRVYSGTSVSTDSLLKILRKVVEGRDQLIEALLLERRILRRTMFKEIAFHEILGVARELADAQRKAEEALYEISREEAKP